MTRQKAIKKLQERKAEYLDEWVDFSGIAGAYDMAIEALEQELNENCISRKWVLDKLEDYRRDYPLNELDDWQNTVVDWIVIDIENAPSIVSKEKMGKWVKVSGYVTPGGDPVWECSECGKGRHVYGIEASSYQRDVSNQQWVACPNCGARMSK